MHDNVTNKQLAHLHFVFFNVLVQMWNIDYTTTLVLENVDLGLIPLVPPPMREKEKHGNAKRKRKVMFVPRDAVMCIIVSSLLCCRCCNFIAQLTIP
jgi:hypothetical protein